MSAAHAGGIAADRYPRRTVLIGVETVRTAIGVVAAALSLTGTLRLGHLVTIAFVIGVAEGFSTPPTRRACRHCCRRTSCWPRTGSRAVLVVVGPIEVLVPFAVRDRTGTGAGGYAAVLASDGSAGHSGRCSSPPGAEHDGTTAP